MSLTSAKRDGESRTEPEGQIELLRFVTAGSVDDGKSTLIGRLLFESKGLYEDQLESVREASGRRGSAQRELDLSLVTDGLKAEREQGITIDVAYRYFSTPKRSFIIADTPGHEQYTRNMATGASTADLAVILVDASKGVLPQSRRHAFISSLLGIRHLAVAINKMDLVDWSQERFEQIVSEFQEFAARLESPHITFIPMSALEGDNVVQPSERMPWYGGRTLLSHLETVHVASDRNLIDLRFPVQYVSRLDDGGRGYMGTPASGIVRPGDQIVVIPSGQRSRVAKVLGVDAEVDEGYPPMPLTIEVEDELDISRGDMLAHPGNVPQFDRVIEVMMVWMSDAPMELGRSYLLKQATRRTAAEVVDLRYKIDINSLRRAEANVLGLNEIGRCVLELSRPIAYDSYGKNRTTGSVILVDRLSRSTIAAGVILDREPNEFEVDEARRVRAVNPSTVRAHLSPITPEERTRRQGHRPATIWLTGLTGSGKSSIAYALERRLFDRGLLCQVLDGENLRRGLSNDLGFAAEDRAENNRRAAEVARLFNEAGGIAICAFVSPYREERKRARSAVGPERFLEIHVKAPIDVCRARAPDAYEKADQGQYRLFPGVSAPYESPVAADMVLATQDIGIDEAAAGIEQLLADRGVIEQDD